MWNNIEDVELEVVIQLAIPLVLPSALCVNWPKHRACIPQNLSHGIRIIALLSLILILRESSLSYVKS